MSRTIIDRAGGEGRRDAGIAASRGPADWLSLAASPVFAIMALAIAEPGGGPAGVLASAEHGSSPLSGMALMYLLMSVIHSAPWLRIFSARRIQNSNVRTTREEGSVGVPTP